MQGVVRNVMAFAMNNLLDEALFSKNISVEKAKQLFIKYAASVEIENHNYCNRTCWFCPVSIVDRRSKLVLMKDELFNKIITDLSSINWARKLVWSRYHEAFAHESIFERLRIARNALPRAVLIIFTNGDYLKREYIEELEDCGVNLLKVSIYPPDGKEDDEAVVEKCLRNFQKRTGLKLEKIHGAEYSVSGVKFTIKLKVRNFGREPMTTRGGSVDRKGPPPPEREHLCIHPLHDLVIDYNGKAPICCETLSDYANHKDVIAGDLNQDGYSLFHLYRDLAPFRANLLSRDKKLGVCATCVAAHFVHRRYGRIPWLAAPAGSLPGLRSAFERVNLRHLHSLASKILE